MSEQFHVLFVGGDADMEYLHNLLVEGGLPAILTRVSAWADVRPVSADWDAIVAGGPGAPCDLAAVRAGIPEGLAVPVLAVVNEAVPPVPLDPGSHGIEWFDLHGLRYLVPVLRAAHRAATAERRRAHDRRRAEMCARQLRQRGRMHAVGQVAAGVAHEFNNLLMVIGAYSDQLMQRAASDGALWTLVQPIQRAGLRGNELTRRLLAFSRDQPGARCHSRVNDAAREAAAMLQPLLGAPVSLALRLAEGLPVVPCSQGQVVEIITNLVVNARDAMPSGGLVTVTTRLAEPPGTGAGEIVELLIQDTGVGMSADTLARIWDPFFTTKRPGVGTGLGLSLVRDIVQEAGGTIALASTPGCGTEVRVRLPASDAAGQAGDAKTDPARGWGRLPTEKPSSGLALPASVPPASLETVLVVEDELSVREIVTQFLSHAGYSVIAAKDAEDAVAALRRDPSAVDLLVTDIVLPGRSGPDLAGLLREYAPQMRTLFISGYPADVLGVAESTTFLSKPFSQAALLEAVRRTLIAPRHR